MSTGATIRHPNAGAMRETGTSQGRREAGKRGERREGRRGAGMREMATGNKERRGRGKTRRRR